MIEHSPLKILEILNIPHILFIEMQYDSIRVL